MASCWVSSAWRRWWISGSSFRTSTFRSASTYTSLRMEKTLRPFTRGPRRSRFKPPENCRRARRRRRPSAGAGVGRVRDCQYELQGTVRGHGTLYCRDCSKPEASHRHAHRAAHYRPGGGIFLVADGSYGRRATTGRRPMARTTRDGNAIFATWSRVRATPSSSTTSKARYSTSTSAPATPLDTAARSCCR